MEIRLSSKEDRHLSLCCPGFTLQKGAQLTFPDATCIILGTCDDGVAAVVKCTAKYFVSVTLEDLRCTRVIEN